MRLISQFSRASGARFSETDDSPETVVRRWILPAKLKALLGSSTLLSQVVVGKDLMVESKSPLFGIAPFQGWVGPLDPRRPPHGERAGQCGRLRDRGTLRARPRWSGSGPGRWQASRTARWDSYAHQSDSGTKCLGTPHEGRWGKGCQHCP